MRLKRNKWNSYKMFTSRTEVWYSLQLPEFFVVIQEKTKTRFIGQHKSLVTLASTSVNVI